jgi:hypothetical protein
MGGVFACGLASEIEREHCMLRDIFKGDLRDGRDVLVER